MNLGQFIHGICRIQSVLPAVSESQNAHHLNKHPSAYNISQPTMFQEHLYKQQLFNTMGKDNELVDTVKLHLREKIISKLKSTQPAKPTPTDSALLTKLICSLFLDYLTEHRLLHTASVFAPESGTTRNQFSREELMSLFRVDLEGSKSVLEGILRTVLPKGRLQERQTDAYVQTDDRECIANLENKLGSIEFEYKQKMMMGLRNVEESEQRFLKYKNDMNKRYKEELEKELDRVRNFELANIRLDEQEKNKLKMRDYQEQLEIAYKARMDKVREREAELIQRVAAKMKQVEKYNYDVRQRALKDMEAVKAKEEELERLKAQLDEKERLLRSGK